MLVTRTSALSDVLSGRHLRSLLWRLLGGIWWMRLRGGRLFLLVLLVFLWMGVTVLLMTKENR